MYQVMKQFRQEFIPLLCVIAVLFAGASPVFSQTPSRTPAGTTPTPKLLIPSTQPETGVDLSLSPTFLSLVTDPGETATSQFKVTNNNAFREYLRINIAKFTASSDGGSPVIADIEEGDEFSEWISFSEKEFTVDPGEAKTIRVTLMPPADAALGYYYALVVSRINPAQASEGQQTIIAGSPALSLLLNVRSPNAKRELQVVDFKTEKLFYEYLPSVFEVKVKNTGNVHVVPIGDIFIDSAGKKDIAVLQANSGKGNILPQTTRTFTASWNDGFAVIVPKLTEDGEVELDDTGNPKYTTDYDFTKADKFRIGKYTANLLLVYDNGDRDVPIEATVSFWVIPWKILLIAAVILIFTLLGIKNVLVSNYRRIKKFKK